MKLIKKSILTFLAIAVSASLVACGPKKDESKKENSQKIEYINELTKSNVEDVVIEYKEILTYYNDLKNNLKVLDDVSKNPDLERDAVNAKDSLKNGRTLLSNTKTLYKPLVDARTTLLKMYDLSISMADNVIKDSKQYQKDLSDYDVLFKEFKAMMDQIRTDIKAIRGIAPTEDKETTTENPTSENTTQENKTDVDKKDDNKGTTTSTDKNEENKKPSVDNNSNSSDKNTNSDKNDQGDGFVPSVSSLNNNIRSEIKNAGYSAGAAYKQSGGSDSNLDQIAISQFNDIEGDNPIQKNQLSEARSIFVNAFKKAYNSTK